VRFHHRLTVIHPFANGNGRHARLLTDILLVNLLKQPRFTWGIGNLITAGDDCRKQYIDALRAADRYDYEPLLAFVRS
jgi:fido (protein-threonine AMPylation protein)